MPFWQDKQVFITGASSGIGRALAEHVASRGARLGLIARRQDKLAGLAAEIQTRMAATPLYAVADVSVSGETQAAIQTLEDQLGRCDVLVANAGVHCYTRGDRFNAANARATFATNVGGVIDAVAAVLPGMLDRGSGHVVAVASIAAMLGLPEVGAYSASKAAIVTLMESLRVDLHPHNVKVTTICPGFVWTPMIAGHPRSALKFVLTPDVAARRIARAIQRGKAEYWFPRRMWALARLARAMPFPIYRRICALIPERSPAG